MMAFEIGLGIVMGSIFLISSAPKLRHPRGFVFAVLNYHILPPSLGKVYALLVPPLELLIALGVLMGIAVRIDGAIMTLLLSSYLIAVAINMARGRTLECNCFGAIKKQPIGWRLLVQDCVLVLASLVLTGTSQTWLGPESWSVFRLTGLSNAERGLPFFIWIGSDLLITLLLISSGWTRKKLMFIRTKQITTAAFPDERGIT